jgi:hypothetical protein
MYILDSPKSGRSGDVVFFMIRNQQRERAYVIPKTVRNAATKRARTAFGALSKAYSTLLTAEQQKVSAAARMWMKTTGLKFHSISPDSAIMFLGFLKEADNSGFRHCCGAASGEDFQASTPTLAVDLLDVLKCGQPCEHRDQPYHCRVI